ncbi:MAG TPA: c-type cytochrome [Gaiellaceae bacterium]|nr:c-type cytochrome [Gaiellaceae bacterium]
MAQRRRKNPWVSATEVLVWVLFALLLVPAGFAGWAIGHYTSLGKSSGTATVTETVTTTAAAPTTTAATTTAAQTTTAAAGSGGNAAAGKAVFASNSCASCHTFAAAGASGKVGPDLDTAPAADAKSANMTLAAFLKQSIVDPNAYIAKGYSSGVMPQTFGKSLTATQLADLVAFLGG